MELFPCSPEQKRVIRAIGKKHGIKGCTQQLRAVFFGKQSARFSKEIALKVVAELKTYNIVTETEITDINDVLLLWSAVK